MIPNKFNVLIKFEFGTINNCELVFSFQVELQISGKKGEIRKRKTNKYISLNVFKGLNHFSFSKHTLYSTIGC